MPKTSGLPPYFKTATIALFALAILLPSSIAQGQNPVNDPLRIFWLETDPLTGESAVQSVKISSNLWKPEFFDANSPGTTWNNVFSNPIRSPKVPIENRTPVSINGYAYPAQAYTGYSLDKVNDFWELFIYQTYDYRIEEPNTYKNCHGHSAGWQKNGHLVGYWLKDFNILINKDYDSYINPNYSGSFMLGKGTVIGDSRHSIKVEDVWGTAYGGQSYVALFTTEKYRDSGVYEKRYYTAVPANASTLLFPMCLLWDVLDSSTGEFITCISTLELFCDFHNEK